MRLAKTTRRSASAEDLLTCASSPSPHRADAVTSSLHVNFTLTACRLKRSTMEEPVHEQLRRLNKEAEELWRQHDQPGEHIIWAALREVNARRRELEKQLRGI